MSCARRPVGTTARSTSRRGSRRASGCPSTRACSRACSSTSTARPIIPMSFPPCATAPRCRATRTSRRVIARRAWRCFTRPTGTRCGATSTRGSATAALSSTSRPTASAPSSIPRTEPTTSACSTIRVTSAGFSVRANQPYSGTGPFICAVLREELAGQRYAGIELETSHALTHSPGGCARVAEAILPFLEQLRVS
jgi:hypothetical protein